MERHHDTWDQLTGYVLGELAPEVHAGVQAHLTQCAQCALEAQQLSGGVDAVALSVAPLAPAPGVKRRILAELASPQVPHSVRVPVVAATSSVQRVSQWWLAIAAMTVVVLGGMMALSQQRVARLVEQREESAAVIATLTEEAATVSTQADLAVAILTAPDMRRIDLQGSDDSRDATARAYWSGTRGLLIVADRLPSPPPGRMYQVWLIGAGAPSPVSAGLIDGRSGRGMLIVPPPGELTGRSVTVAVTDEPQGGLSAPSGSKHLVGSM